MDPLWMPKDYCFLRTEKVIRKDLVGLFTEVQPEKSVTAGVFKINNPMRREMRQTYCVSVSSRHRDCLRLLVVLTNTCVLLRDAVPIHQPPIHQDPDQWDYIEEGVLSQTRSSRVCITCQHFDYTTDPHCHTLLTCRLQARLIPNGEHLTKKCRHWLIRREKEFGWCPEAA